MRNKKSRNKIAVYMLCIIVSLMITTIIVSAADTLEGDVSDVIKSLSGSSNYRPAGTDKIQGTGKLVDFYNRHQSLIDFFVMFTLFATVALVGLNKVGFGEGGNAMKGMALAVGAALALAALKAGYSPSFFVPFVKNFLFLIIFLIIFLVIKAVLGGEHAGTGTIVVSLILALVVTWVAFNVSNLVIEGDANKFNLANGLGWILSSTPTDTSEDRIMSDSELTRLSDTIKEKKDEKARIEKTYFENEVPETGFTATQIETLLKTETDKEKKTYLKRLAALIEEIKALETLQEKADAKRRAIEKEAEKKKAKEKPADAPAEPTIPKPVPEPVTPKPADAPNEPAKTDVPVPQVPKQPSDLPTNLEDVLDPNKAPSQTTPSTTPNTQRSRPSNSPDDL